MAIIVNDKDKLLQATTVRLLSSSNNYIYFDYPAPVFNIDSGGTASPANYTITAQFAGQLRGAGTVTWSVVSGTIATTGISGNNWTVAAVDLTTNTAVIRASLLYLGVTYTADLTVSKLTSGAAAVFADLISESDVVASEADGTGYTLPTGNSLRLYIGGTIVSTGVTYSGTATKNGLTLTINSTTGAITLTGTSWTSNQESFTITATYNSVSYTSIYSIAKSKRGNDAILIDLISDADIVFAATDGTGYTLPVGNNIRLYKGGVVLTTGVTYSGTATKNGLTLTVNSTTGEIVLSGTSWTSNQESFTVVATYNLLSYTIIYTIAKSRTGATGVTGSSARICYSKTTLSSLATTPTTITTTGSSSFPPNNSWGTGTVWQATAPSIVAGESVYQSDGIYNPTTGNTIWNVPYLSNLKVGKLESIVSSTGQLTINSDGHIKGGQTAYSTGNGFFLGYDINAYKLSIGSFKTGTADVSTNTITCANHGYLLYSQIMFTSVGSITGITTTRIYTVINVTTNTFQVTQTYGGAVVDLTGTNSVVGFTAQAIYWTGNELNISGNFRGGTLGIGSGKDSSGYAFYVNEAGVVTVSNIFGGIGIFDNSRFTSADALTGYSSIDAAGVVGSTNVGNTGSAAHGVRGRNNYQGTSGLVGVANGYDFYADGAGTNYGPFTGNHDILIPIDQTLEEGTLVVDVQCIARNNWSNALFQVAPSTVANQAGARGVFVGQLRPLSSVKPPAFISHWVNEGTTSVPVMTEQYEAIKDNYWFGSMNSIGEGQIQVCGENGNIEVDTLIVTSNTAGVGMAQSDDIIRSKTVAKAREAVTFSSPEEVKIVACIYLCG